MATWDSTVSGVELPDERARCRRLEFVQKERTEQPDFRPSFAEKQGGLSKPSLILLTDALKLRTR